MAAGLGFKDFTTGEVLTAADVDGYLMQGIWVFASAAARDAAVTSPQEGNFAFLKDTNTTTYYTGSAWTNLDTTGMVNPMTTTGDTIYSSSGSTPARLGIGTAGQVLTVNSGATAPEWATPAGATTFPTFRAYRGTDQNITSGVWTKVQLNTESWDTNNNFDPTTNYRFTPTVAGYYQINGLAYIYSLSGNNGNYMMSIYKNGTQYATWMALNDTGYQLALSTLVYFNGTTDYIEMYARGTATGTIVVSAGPTDNYLDGIGIRS